MNKFLLLFLFAYTFIHCSEDIREDGIVASLYLPESSPQSESPLPVIITLSGSNGGLSETRAKALADEGFASLALGYFGVDGLPDKLQSIPLEYFEKAFDWIEKHPKLDESRVGLHGISRGGELALILGSWFPEKLHAIVATAPSSVIIGTREGIDAWTYKGKQLTPFAYVGSKMTGGDKDHPIVTRQKFMITPHCTEAAIPIEKFTGPLMLITGGDDKVWPAEIFAEKIKEKKPDCIHLHYPLAGHGINAPMSDAKEPLYLHPVAKKWFDCGGTIEENQKASEDSWQKLTQFFKENLNDGNTTGNTT